jgi:hypothetical protein
MNVRCGLLLFHPTTSSSPPDLTTQSSHKCSTSAYNGSCQPHTHGVLNISALLMHNPRLTDSAPSASFLNPRAFSLPQSICQLPKQAGGRLCDAGALQFDAARVQLADALRPAPATAVSTRAVLALILLLTHPLQALLLVQHTPLPVTSAGRPVSHSRSRTMCALERLAPHAH